MNPRRRTAAYTLLYAAEGAPIGFIWWALPTLMRADGVPVERITGLTALLLLPWIFKFAWAPLVDMLRSASWGFRSWIASAQVVMGLAIVPLIWLDPAEHFGAWRGLLLIHAFSAATQDVAIDALAINNVTPAERGFLNGCMQAGMLTGRSVFGGGALFVTSWLGREWMLAALVAWVWIAMGALALVDEPEAPRPPARDRVRAFGDAFGGAFRSRLVWLGIAFALVSAAAFEATGQLAGPFLVDRGVPPARIGVFFGVFVVGATLVGGLVGGRLSDRWGRGRSVAVFLAGFVAAVVALAAADLAGAGAAPLMATLAAMYFFIGLFTAASYALYMDLTDPRVAGTQFSAFMAATNGCESWSAFAGGRIAAGAGYPASFLTMSAVSLLSLLLLRRLPARLRRLNP